MNQESGLAKAMILELLSCTVQTKHIKITAWISINCHSGKLEPFS